MSNNDVNSANGQYDNPPFGMSGITSTGAQGGAVGSTYGSYADGRLPGGENLDAYALSSTGAPGSAPQTPPSDGGTVSATSPFGYLDGTNAPQVHGTSATSKDSLSGIDVHGSFGGPEFDAVDTGAGRGSAGHSHNGRETP